MAHDVYWIAGISPGRLGIAPRPRGGEWLKRDLQALRAAKVDTLVSLLTQDERAEFDLADEEQACVEAGIRFRAFPIPDRGVPPSPTEFARLVEDLRSDLQGGKTVLVHCRQGIGRSGLLLASVLVDLGEHPDRAFNRVEQARGLPVPETEAQLEWVKRYAAVAHREDAKSAKRI